MSVIDLKLPDIGGSTDVNVAEVYVKVGDTIAIDDNLVMLETEKATMEVPATSAGTVVEVKVKVGSKVQEGDIIIRVDSKDGVNAATADKTVKDGADSNASKAIAAPETTSPASSSSKSVGVAADMECDVLVLGAGPGGYTAAFRAADLGKK